MIKNKTMKKKLFIPVIAIAAFLINAGTFLPNGISSRYVNGNDTLVSFENCEVNKLPKGFTQASTGKL